MLNLKKEKNTMRNLSVFSQPYHLLAFSIKKPKMKLKTGMLIISIDVDVGNRELGLINKGKNDKNISSDTTEYQVGMMDEITFPFLASIFEDFQVPVTFAIRGQLLEVKDSILNLLLKSSVNHEIGAHGYYHRVFTKLSRNEAETELKLISEGMNKLGITPRSFVFPKNLVSHLDLLVKYGYKCYRSLGNYRTDCMYIEKQGELYNIHPSLYFDACVNTSSIFAKKMLDIAIAKKVPFHIWFHLWNFGETEELIQRNIKRMLFPLLNYAKKKEKSGDLKFETMLSAAEEIEKLGP
jgi:peptidoglycan/xylan/chitin deacetylase (PgdA/CDA1 family)